MNLSPAHGLRKAAHQPAHHRATMVNRSNIFNMQEQEIYAQLTTIFRDLFDDNTLVLTPTLTAADVPEWDSFNHINLIVAIEAQFHIKFHTAELESMHDVGHLVSIIRKKLDAPPR